MKKIFLTALIPFIVFVSFGQNKEAAEKIVDEGIAYHDKGDYTGAIAKYDKALALDKDNLFALVEKAYSLLGLKKYDEVVSHSRKAIKLHPGEQMLTTLYVTYGNALDGLKKTDEAIAVYDEGIKQFPGNYQLYYNKGVTLASVKKYDDAIACFQKAVVINPAHASSHNGIARLSGIYERRIPSLLAYCRFLAIEPSSGRAKENLAAMQKLVKAGVEKTGKNSISISLDMGMLNDTTAGGKRKENSFTSTDMILSMVSGLDYDKKNKKKTDVELFISKMETVCASLAETRRDNYGFFWDYYVPYFTEMNEKKLLETFAYIAFASSEDADVTKWLENNKADVSKFIEWSKGFKWKTD